MKAIPKVISCATAVIAMATPAVITGFVSASPAYAGTVYTCTNGTNIVDATDALQVKTLEAQGYTCTHDHGSHR